MTLAQIVGLYYTAKVLGKGTTQAAFDAFNEAAKEQSFRDTATLELAKLEAVFADQCFASKQQREFLREAIAQMPPITALPQVDWSSQEDDMTSKFKNLADLAKSVTSGVESRAEEAANRLQRAQEKANGGLDKLDSVTADLEKSAADIENFANQVSNFPPS